LKDDDITELVRKHHKIEVITAFDVRHDELQDAYGDKLILRPINPWRHNRHMTIVCRGATPLRAVYFARRLRTPLITPVYLPSPSDAARVMRAFELMRAELEEEMTAAR
jgi:hypothetical protein